MSKDSKALKIAKGLILLSLNDDGKADQQRVEEVISELRKEGVFRVEYEGVETSRLN